ncbi:MAG: hypothetical protein H6807_09105 [Planctomycetes bacterium]|nr:hypothetical protein [Planctomycetota bacterium]
MPSVRALFVLVFLVVVGPDLPAQDGPRALDRAALKELGDLAREFWKLRPPSYFVDRDQAAWEAYMAKLGAWGELPEGSLETVLDQFWKLAARSGPSLAKKQGGKGIIETPYGDAWFYMKGSGRKKGLVLGLHGGGEGAGSADEAAGKWSAKNCIGFYPQGIRLVHDTWNTVHGERFLLSMIEIAKCQFGIDPDRVYTMGFSMGGTGSWFMAGRHPDLLAGSSPCAGVLMAEPKSQLPRKEDIVKLQHGFVPNVRNLAMWYYIGLSDRNCMPGTYLYVADLLEELRRDDPEGYQEVHFKTYEGLAHSFPPGEPQAGIAFLEQQTRKAFPKKLVWEYCAWPFPRRDDADKVTRYQKTHFYWLRCSNPFEQQVIRAEQEGNTFKLRFEGRTRNKEKGISIMLNPKMIDVAQDVVVILDGQEVYRGRPKPRLDVLVDSLDAKVDTTLVFDRRIDL